jgi:hypothetical protein
MSDLLNQPEYINLKSQLFVDTVNLLIKKHSLAEIVETGTFNGLGSTKVFAETGLNVVSLESCKTHYEVATNNLKNYPNVKILHASSLSLNEMRKFIEEDTVYKSELVFTKKINVDGGENAKSFYLQEICGFDGGLPPEDNKLWDLINNHTRQLVFLDSAGGVGYLEFLQFMKLEPDKLKTKVLLMDDIFHVKHYRSIVKLKNDYLYPVISSDRRFAYCEFIPLDDSTNHIL